MSKDDENIWGIIFFIFLLWLGFMYVTRDNETLKELWCDSTCQRMEAIQEESQRRYIERMEREYGL